MTEEPKLAFIQALRGFAALAVAVSHLRFALHDQNPWLQSLLQLGSAGVDLFFVISGFIMVYTTRNNDGSGQYASDFLAKRFLRIWVPYAFVGLFFFCLLTPNPFSNENLVWIAKSLLFIPPDAAQTFYLGSGLLLVAWSLNYEFFFYLLFGGSLLFGRFRWLALAAAFVLLTVVVPMLYHGSFTFSVNTRLTSGPALLQMMTNPMLLEFAAGVLIGLIYFSSIRIGNSALCWVFLSTLLAAGAIIWLSAFRPENGLLGWGLPAVIAVFALAISSKTLPLSPPRFLVFLGTISYSLYLVHLPIELKLLGPYLAPKMSFFIFAPVALAASIAAAALAYVVFERLVHDQLRRALMARLSGSRRGPTAQPGYRALHQANAA
ncbi:MAG: acyltransferase [Xanthobacteraceae bacterium]